MQERRDDLERVADAVIDLPHQERSLGRQRLEAIARGAHLRLRRVAGAAHAHARHGLLDRGLKQRDEFAADRLDDVVGRALGAHHQLHRAGVVAGETPVAAGVEISERDVIFEPEADRRGGSRDLPGHEVRRSAR